MHLLPWSANVTAASRVLMLVGFEEASDFEANFLSWFSERADGCFLDSKPAVGRRLELSAGFQPTAEGFQK